MLMTVGPWKTEHFLPSFLLFFSICFSLFIGSMMALGISRCNSIEEKNLKKWKTHIPHILFNNCYFFLQKMNTRNGEGHQVWILYLQLILSNFLLICENWSSCVWKKKAEDLWMFSEMKTSSLHHCSGKKLVVVSPLPSPFGRRQEDSSGWCFGGQQLSEAQLINEANQFCQSVVSTLDLLWSFFTVTTEGCFRFLCSVFENAYIWGYSSMIRNEFLRINFTETEEKPKRGF